MFGSTAPGRISRPSFGGLDLEDRIGAGGYGTVWRARDSGDPPRRYAVKILHQPLIEPSARRRFARECEALRRLAGAGGIVRIHGAGIDEAGLAHIITDLYGATVADRLRAKGRLDPEEVADLGRQVTEALITAHAAGVIHGDLKPGNLFLGDGGRVHLGDFGAATLTDVTVDSAAPMSVRFTAPEVLDGAAVNEHTDLYGLGATLHQLATGEPPTIGGGTDLAGVPSGLAQLIERLVDPRADRRGSSAADVAAAFDDLSVRGLDRPTKSPGGTAWRPLALAIGIALAAGTIIAITPLTGLLDRGGSTTADVADTGPGPETTEGAIVDRAALAEAAKETSGQPSATMVVDLETTDDSAAGPSSPRADQAPNGATDPTCDPRATDAVLCDSFDDGASGWTPFGDPSAMTITGVADGAVGAGLLLAPTEVAVSGGQHWVQRGIAGPTAGQATTLRLQLRVNDPAADNPANGGELSDDWLTVVELLDENDRRWSFAVKAAEPGRFNLALNHWDQVGSDSANNRPSETLERGRSYCVTFAVQPGGPQAMRLGIDGVAFATLDESFDYGDAATYRVLLGPAWVQGRPPAVTIDELAVATAGSLTC